MSDEGKLIKFVPKCGFDNQRGVFSVNDEGIIMFQTRNAMDGKEIVACLATDEEEQIELLGFLIHCLQDHQEKSSTESVLDPDLAAMLNLNNLH